MKVMPSNNTGFECGYLFGKHPERLAHLHSVDALREPRPGIPWALDNGVFGECQHLLIHKLSNPLSYTNPPHPPLNNGGRKGTP